MADWIKRTLEMQDYSVLHVTNITDVGHMRHDVLERGGDKVILAALAEGKTPREISKFYTDLFMRDLDTLNILHSQYFPKATDHVEEMIKLIQKLVDRGLAYQVDNTVYFAVKQFAAYGQLSRNIGSNLIEAVRSEKDPMKRDPRDFTLWKSAEPGREMKWPSPWGEGFPGWHIECSAMSTKYLGDTFDIHTGGVDNVFPHHEGEIAQSNGALDKQVVKYWVHGQHLLVDGVKMAKSSGNVFTLDDLGQHGFDHLAFRYHALTVHYRKRINFTMSALKASEKALTRLRDNVWRWSNSKGNLKISKDVFERYRGMLLNHMNDDLNLPTALSNVWKLTGCDMNDATKLAIVMDIDKVFGLGLDRFTKDTYVTEKVIGLSKQRESFRKNLKYNDADVVREKIFKAGFMIRDDRDCSLVRAKTKLELQHDRYRYVSASNDIESFIDKPDAYSITFVLVACNYIEDVKRCLNSVIRHTTDALAEFIVIDNCSTDGTGDWVEHQKEMDDRIKLIRTDHVVGEAMVKNIGLKQARGEMVIMLDTSVELTGDIVGIARELLKNETVGLVGAWGLKSNDLKHFHEEVTDGESDAMQAYCIALRRNILSHVGLMRESFRFYRNLDIDYSFQVKNRGYSIFADKRFPLIRHDHRQWNALEEEEREKLSRINFKRFFKRWGSRTDLLS